MATKGPTKTVNRSSVSGQFVKAGYAKSHKSTTETQRVHVTKKK